ncbi:MAG: hypothetical protein G01um101438_367 [Parcubacteria group bacterium Gr01-1014_38]|nr:MAG: hypothetical protein G01um101438_367 [Parcubacteria group bacterium Gr01-1014_38]
MTGTSRIPKFVPVGRRASGGFTLIEMVVTLAILVAMLALASPFLLSFHTRGLLDDAAEQISQDLRRAQSLAIAGEGSDGVSGRKHGVYIKDTNLPGNWEGWVLFTGVLYTDGAASNEVHVLPTTVDLVSATLAGGGSTIVFAERTGRTADTGSIVLRSGSEQVTLTVNSAGRVSR